MYYIFLTYYVIRILSRLIMKKDTILINLYQSYIFIADNTVEVIVILKIKYQILFNAKDFIQ